MDNQGGFSEIFDIQSKYFARVKIILGVPYGQIRFPIIPKYNPQFK